MMVCPNCQHPLIEGSSECTSCGFSSATIEGFLSWAPEMAYGSGGFKKESFAHLAQLEAANF